MGNAGAVSMAIPCASSDAVIKNFSFSILNFSFK